ncbi:hypothetical protein ADK77_08400 [Streptomyces antibioticus]|nr:hypothetical protein [Streptomyces antibioticus]KOG73541.1 hypothetical protein ADK77_08400 [Streptomyces antibioticus]
MGAHKVIRKRWHWIITIAWRDGRFWDMAMYEGTCAPLPGHTREMMFTHFYDKVVKQSGATDAYVLFFSLEPDELVPED